MADDTSLADGLLDKVTHEQAYHDLESRNTELESAWQAERADKTKVEQERDELGRCGLE